MKPYIFLENNKLIDKQISPERGQLLISILESDLEEETLEKIFSRADFSYADLDGIKFNTKFFNGINLSHANLNNVEFPKHSEFIRANLQHISMTKSKLDSTILDFIQLEEADLRGSSFRGANFMHASLSGAKFNPIEIEGKELFIGSDYLSKAMFKGNYKRKADLEGANINFSLIKDTDFTEANLERTSWKGTHLGGIFNDINFEEIDLDSAKVKLPEYILELEYRGFSKEQIDQIKSKFHIDSLDIVYGIKYILKENK